MKMLSSILFLIVDHHYSVKTVNGIEHQATEPFYNNILLLVLILQLLVFLFNFYKFDTHIMTELFLTYETKPNIK
jgi:hypothetical protein